MIVSRLVPAPLYRRLHEGVNARLARVAGGRLAAHCRPTSIALLMTKFCNARCLHCDIWKNRGQEDSPTLEQWKTVLTDLRAWLGPVHVYLTGGEALLQPFTPALLAHGSSIGLWMELLTHGFWPDPARIERAALANPGQITLSLDGVGDTHSTIRGRRNFYDVTLNSIRMLQRVRRERGLGYNIRLKTVVMAHNLDDCARIVEVADEPGMDVFYQPIEQNYNTPDDQRWFESSPNWPRDTARAVAVVRELIALKAAGRPIANSQAQLEAMIPYFSDPGSMRVAVQAHSGHEARPLCSAVTNLQLESNGDVHTCAWGAVVGNIKQAGIRTIWEERPAWWRHGCCREWRSTPDEQRAHGLTV